MLQYVVKAEYLEDYKIKIWFEDGVEKIIDLYPYISSNPRASTRRFLDKDLFKKVYIEDGGLCWEDRQFDISPESLYLGDFDAK